MKKHRETGWAILNNWTTILHPEDHPSFANSDLNGPTLFYTRKTADAYRRRFYPSGEVVPVEIRVVERKKRKKKP